MFSQAEKELTAELVLSFETNQINGDGLKAFRKKIKLTQEQFAKALDVNFYTYRSWEQNLINPPYWIMKRLRELSNDSINFP